MSFETDYLNILTILKMAHIPMRRADRARGGFPLVIAGGSAVFLNPEPIADFIDLFLIGEGEEMIPEFLAGIAYLIRRAGELNIRDQLVVVVQSEMGRTPNYNAGNGKDHWSIGSAMFLGRGIKGNRVIGATDEKQFAVPLDPQTLTVDKAKGIRVRPEHIHQSLRELAGIADHALSKKFSLGLADKEKIQKFWG